MSPSPPSNDHESFPPMKLKETLSLLLAATMFATAAPASEPAKAPAAVNADPALWVVKDADTTIYLFGTIHLMRPEVQWFDGGVKSAYAASSELVIEMVEPEPAKAQSIVMSTAVDPDGPPLTQKLNPKSVAEYKKAMEQLNLPTGSFEQFEPWFVSTLLAIMPLQKYGLSPESGVDKVLAAAAKRDGKTIIGLETMEEQIGFFDNLPEPLQIEFLDQTIKGLPKYGKLIDMMVGSWAAGKTEKLGNAMTKSMKSTPEITKVLLKDRNARWADWIVKRMDKPGTVFLAVGAGHLAGKDSVQTMLNTRKLKAVRIPS